MEMPSPIQAESQSSLSRLKKLMDVSMKVLSETTLEGLLRNIVEAACEVIDAKIGVSGHGYRDGVFQIGAAAKTDV